MAEISFPFRIDDSGAVAIENNPNLLARDHVRSVIGTYPGERVMRPTFGLPTRDFLFDNVTGPARADLMSRINSSLQVHVPEVTFQTLDVTRDTDDPSLLRMAVSYAVRSSSPASISDQVTAVVSAT